jgi:predicted RNA-binding protein with RPS1 domain
MREHLGEEYGGKVSSVTSFGLFVQLDGLYVEGLIHITELGGEYFRFDEARQELRGERSGMRYGVGARVRVQVSRVDLDGRKIDFRLVHEGEGAGLLPARHRREKAQAERVADKSLAPAAELADQLRGQSPIVAQFKASQTANGIEYDGAPIAPIPETTAELFRDEFLIAISQITGPEVAARYDEGGEFAGLVELYHGEAWTPTAAAINESLAPGEQRLITDGPPGVNAPGAADGGDADDPGVNPSENAGE